MWKLRCRVSVMSENRLELKLRFRLALDPGRFVDRESWGWCSLRFQPQARHTVNKWITTCYCLLWLENRSCTWLYGSPELEAKIWPAGPSVHLSLNALARRGSSACTPVRLRSDVWFEFRTKVQVAVEWVGRLEVSVWYGVKIGSALSFVSSDSQAHFNSVLQWVLVCNE